MARFNWHLRFTHFLLLISLLSSVSSEIKGQSEEGSFQEGSSSSLGPANNEPVSPKLLVLLIDGFRWDYYDRLKQQLPGLRQFLSDGVQVEHVEPIFPSLSYPSWTTLVTGLYPSQHGIIGNYMLHLGDDELPESVFQLKDNSTKSTFWWRYAEPLWTTATKAGQKVYMANFANCDVPFEGIPPTECSGYQYRDVNFKLREHLNKALTRFRHGYSLAMIYDDSIDHAGHVFGPESNELKVALVALDSLIQEFLFNLKSYGLDRKVNLIVTSDHGMTSIKKDSGMDYVKLEDYLEDPNDTVYKVVDYGAVVTIAANKGKTDELYHQLGSMPGVTVYQKSDIPEQLHFKESPFVHDILLIAKPGFFIVGLKGDKQIPNDSKSSSVQPYLGSHGYYNVSDMWTIFFARGPAFKKGLIHPVIRLEDEYQIFVELLGLQPPRPHYGSWKNVAGMFEDEVEGLPEKNEEPFKELL